MSDVERELRAELLRVNSTGDCLEKENAGLRATIVELRSQLGTLAKAWRAALLAKVKL